MSGVSASAIDALAVLTRAQPMKTHQAMTQVPTGASHAISSQSPRVGDLSRNRPFAVAAPTASIVPPAIAKRRNDSASGETPHAFVSAPPNTNVAANPVTDNAARKSPNKIFMLLDRQPATNTTVRLIMASLQLSIITAFMSFKYTQRSTKPQTFDLGGGFQKIWWAIVDSNY